jgi:hypothetical protein
MDFQKRGRGTEGREKNSSISNQIDRTSPFLDLLTIDIAKNSN